MKLTPWFTGYQKPVRAGVYERKQGNSTHYSYWCGYVWGAASHDKLLARSYSLYESLSQNLPWRGVMK